MLVSKVDTRKTPKEKAALANAKSKWRASCRAKYGPEWTKRTAAKMFNGVRRM